MRYHAIIILIFFICGLRGDCSCPAGLECCDSQSCYDPNVYQCCNRLLRQLDEPCESSSPPPTSQVYGVNIGGWMTIEGFITPSLFHDPRVVDEWTMGLYYNGTGILERHWDTWVTYNDLVALKNAGINYVRVPIGYWIVMTPEELQSYGEPYITGGWPYLLRFLQWSKSLGLKAVIDLHAAPGCQNPWPHSGHNNSSNWGRGDSINRTLSILSTLSQRILALENNPNVSGVITGLGILNEPYPPVIEGGLSTIKDFYLSAYSVVRQFLSPDRYMIILDWAFSNDQWTDFMSNTSQYQNVVLDAHIYQCFDDGLNHSPYDVHISVACNEGRQQILQQTLPVIVGEWSLCFKQPSETAAEEPYPSPEQQQFMTSYFLAQMNAFDTPHSRGWFFWNFKTESAPMWNYLLGVSDHWIPTLPTNYQSAC